MKTKILILAGLSFFLTAHSQVITVPGSSFGTLTPITVHYSDASGVGSSWIGLYRAESDDGGYITYQYINESTEGSISFPGREETGLFNFRLFRGGGYDKIGTSATFMIRQGALPDLTFGEGGVFRKDFLGRGLDDYAAAVRITADDKIVVAGTAKTGLIGSSGYEQNEFVAVRFLANGQPDPDFGSNGIARAAFNTGMYYGAVYVNATQASAMAVQEDGKVIVGGIAYINGAEFAVKAVLLVRFNNDGTIDNTFGDRGAMVDNFKWPLESATYAWDDLRCIELDPQGRILVGGGSLLDLPYSPGRPFIGRYTKDGAPDLSFGGVRMITPSDSIVFRGYVESIVPPAPGGDGTILAGISDEVMFGQNFSVIYKIKDNGDFVPGFGHNGIRVETRPAAIQGQHLRSIQIAPNGNLIMMGSSSPWAMWLASKNPVDGSDVSAFGNKGVTSFDPTDGWDVPGGMVLAKDNSIIVGTTTYGYRWSVARFAENGSLRTDFGVSFQMLIENGSIVESFVSGIGVQKDGHYVLVGGSKYPSAGNWDFMVLRFIDNPETLSGIAGNPALACRLSQNFPNPFSQSTTFNWSQVSDSHITLVVYDILGNRVAEPVNEIWQAGRHELSFTPGRDGTPCLSPGTYYYQMIIRPQGSGKNTYTETKKMIILPDSR